MKKIKLADYKGDYVCYYNEYNDIVLIGSDEVEKIKELSEDRNIILGTTINKVFDEDFISEIQEFFEDYANDNGYEDINERIDYNSKEFKEVKRAVKAFIKSLGDENNCYSANGNIEIEVE